MELTPTIALEMAKFRHFRMCPAFLGMDLSREKGEFGLTMPFQVYCISNTPNAALIMGA